MTNWLRVFRSAQLLAMVMGYVNSRRREQYGQKNAWHSVAAWHGNARGRRIFSSGAPEVDWPHTHAFSPPTSRGEADEQNSQPVHGEADDLGESSGRVSILQRKTASDINGGELCSALHVCDRHLPRCHAARSRGRRRAIRGLQVMRSTPYI